MLFTIRTLNFMYIIFQNLPATQDTHGLSMTKTKWLMWFGEIISLYSANHAKHKYIVWT